VGVAERVRYLAGDRQRLVDRKVRLAHQTTAQRLAFAVGHDVIEKALGLTRVVEWQDMGMVQAGGDCDLAEEPLGAESGRELGLQNLDGDWAMMLPILGEIDRCHPPAAEFALERIAVSEDGLEASEEIGHGLPQEVSVNSIIGPTLGRARGIGLLFSHFNPPVP